MFKEKNENFSVKKKKAVRKFQYVYKPCCLTQGIKLSTAGPGAWAGVGLTTFFLFGPQTSYVYWWTTGPVRDRALRRSYNEGRYSVIMLKTTKTCLRNHQHPLSRGTNLLGISGQTQGGGQTENEGGQTHKGTYYGGGGGGAHPVCRWTNILIWCKLHKHTM